MAKSTIATAYVQVRPSMEGVASEVRRSYDPAGASAGTGFGKKLVGALKGVIAAAAIGEALKRSIVEGAALEQSIGGIKTLFGDEVAQTVIKNAQAAYETAGLSANAYMETVTGFSASLLQSVGGDAAEAARIADMAITDMSDNANKMGTSMELIQNAYQGFAKQNYTMLDNLKLGYGGTKAEMQRLLADAQAITGIKYDINNLSDVYEAIHVIQKDLGIMGATAAEAASTFTGSFNVMKAALSNVLGYLAIGEDVGPALTALADTIATFVAGNLIPMVWNILAALPGSLVTFATSMLAAIKARIPENTMELVSVFVEQLTTSITDSLPQLVSNGATMLGQMSNGFLSGAPAFLTTVGDLLSQILEAILIALPDIAASGLALAGELAAGLLSNLPAIAEAAERLFARLLGTIAQNLPNIFASGIRLIGELVAGLISAIPGVLTTIFDVSSRVDSAFLEYDWQTIGTEMMNGIVQGITDGAGAIWEAAKEAALWAFEAAKEALGIRSPSRLMREQVGRQVSAGIALGIRDNTNLVAEAVDDLTSGTLSADLRLVGGSVRTIGAANVAGTGRVVNVVQNIYSEAKTAADLMQETLWQQEKAVLLGV